MSMFDARRFLTDHFTDPDGVIGLVAKHGRTPPARQAVKKWFDRGSVPGDWLAVLTVVLDDENGYGWRDNSVLNDYVVSEAPATDIFA